MITCCQQEPSTASFLLPDKITDPIALQLPVAVSHKQLSIVSLSPYLSADDGAFFIKGAGVQVELVSLFLFWLRHCALPAC